MLTTRHLLIAGGAVLGLLAIAVTVFVAIRLSGIGAGPEEVTTREYVTRFCAVVEPHQRALRTLERSNRRIDLTKRSFRDDVEAETAIQYMQGRIDDSRSLQSDLEAFNDGNRLRGRDGDDLASSFTDFITDSRRDLDDEADELSKMDATNVTPKDLAGLGGSGSPPTVRLDSALRGELTSAAEGRRSDCSDAVSSTFSSD